MRKIIGILLLLAVVSADAALLSRMGGAAYYDDVLDITWLADANYAQTSGYDVDGMMSWDEAQAWVGSLNTNDYLGSSSWRLPGLIDNDSNGCDYSYDGTDCGYNVDTSGSELAHLFYETLDNLGWADTSGSAQTGWGLIETADFANIQAGYYWPGTEYATNVNLAWVFNMEYGFQDFGNKLNTFYALAVADGDFGATANVAVPVPASIWLFGSALGFLGWMRRLKHV